MAVHNHPDRELQPLGACPTCDAIWADDDLRIVLSVIASLNKEGIPPNSAMLMERTGFDQHRLVLVLNKAQQAGYIAPIAPNSMN